MVIVSALRRQALGPELHGVVRLWAGSAQQ